jgi:hypothetical protein
MTRERSGLLNQLVSKLPEGLLVDAAWLKAQGYSTQLQHQYVKSGWLEQPTRSVFRRPRGSLSWQQVVISLQTILDYSPLIVGGRTALELQGYAGIERDLHQTISCKVRSVSDGAPPRFVRTIPAPRGEQADARIR